MGNLNHQLHNLRVEPDIDVEIFLANRNFIKVVYQKMHDGGDRDPMNKLIWHSLCPTKMKMISNLPYKRKLNTKVNVHKKGLSIKKALALYAERQKPLNLSFVVASGLLEKELCSSNFQLTA